jgi:hypothetical protein
MKKTSIIKLVLVGAGLLWASTIAAALEAIRRFESTPGQAAEARSLWPATTAVPRTSGAATLVMLIHPHCSCSRASIKELGEIIEKSPRSMRTYVLAYRPSDAKPGWEDTDVYRAAKTLRRTEVVVDVDGAEAKRFGGFTSGQTFLYDAHGRLRFAGGVTSLRGHAGLNRGRADVIRIANAAATNGRHPVFGCAINTPTNRGDQP